jgi:predicted DNA-binding transcriptional regulator YafY
MSTFFLIVFILVILSAIFRLKAKKGQVARTPKIEEFVSSRGKTYQFTNLDNAPRFNYDPEQVATALVRAKRAKILYEDRNSEITERVIIPFKKYYRNDLLYIDAWCEDNEAERTFRADRIIEVVILSDV